MLAATLSILVLQMMPYFIIRRKIYEVRERPSRIYSWKVFIISSIVVELSWNILVAVPMFLSFYYPIAMYRNAEVTGDVVSRGGMMFLLFFLLMVFASTFSIMVIAGIETLETGGNIASPMLSLSLVFCGYESPIPPPPLFFFLCLCFLQYYSMQCPPKRQLPPQSLGRPLPRLPIHILHVLPTLHRGIRGKSTVLQRRTPPPRTTRWSNMRPIHENLHEHDWRVRGGPRRDLELPVLPAE